MSCPTTQDQSLLEKVDKGRGVWHRHCCCVVFCCCCPLLKEISSAVALLSFCLFFLLACMIVVYCMCEEKMRRLGGEPLSLFWD